jgi:Tfp pilus assembly ATPase PilU
LYAALKEINTPEKKILTVEDPVEYLLAGINQVPIRPQIELSFANALRSFLRQDPECDDGRESRDRETANIAIQAAPDRPLAALNAAYRAGIASPSHRAAHRHRSQPQPARSPCKPRR